MESHQGNIRESTCQSLLETHQDSTIKQSLFKIIAVIYGGVFLRMRAVIKVRAEQARTRRLWKSSSQVNREHLLLKKLLPTK